ncbi:MAG: DegT/DnrJ/EryC1/StrS family aminotransferase, partial [Adlercreutzia sp.]|nr:DegT/DnrJ/EryC1/StrS family aminotransferase [Adlercreutzia sp.]
MVYYPKPMHEQGAFDGACVVPEPCEVTQRLCETVLSLPMGPYVAEKDATGVASSLASRCML